MIAPAMSITLPVTDVPAGEPAWGEVEWRRYMLDGQVWVVATVFAWDHEQGQLAAQTRLPTYDIGRPAPRRHREPCGRVVGDALARPGLHRLGVGLLHALLREVEVAGGPRGRGEHARPVVPVRLGERTGHDGPRGPHVVTPPVLDSIGSVGRTSTPPPWSWIGLRPASSSASSRLGTSMT